MTCKKIVPCVKSGVCVDCFIANKPSAYKGTLGPLQTMGMVEADRLWVERECPVEAQNKTLREMLLKVYWAKSVGELMRVQLEVDHFINVLEGICDKESE